MPWHDGQLDLDPAQPLEASLKAVPAKWAVYLMSDADDRPVQILCVKNLRASLKRRLSETVETAPSKKVDYRQLVRRVRWKRVDNVLESDLAFLDVAREVFPDSWQKIVTRRSVWWIHVDLAEPHPRWRVSDNPHCDCGQAFGPIQEKGQAQRLVEKLEDLFDLCRYHNVLAQSPQGVPCAYKDMGKCPAPCDGSVSMQQYRSLVEWSLHTLTDPVDEIDLQTDRMRTAASEMKFETAGKIKAFIDGIKSMAVGEWRFVRPAGKFEFVSVQPGPAKGQAKVFQITIDRCAEAFGLIAEPSMLPEILTEPANEKLDADRLGLIASHLFSTKTGGVFMPKSQATRTSIAAAYRTLKKQVIEKPVDEDEGIVREVAAGG
jgi:excinuclease UvrABC nuclease subunit